MAFRRLHQAYKHLRSTATRTSRRAPRHQRPRFVEPLENRTLLTTLTGTIDPATGLPKDGDVFEYRQTNGSTETVIRVKLQGNIQVELIGAQVNRLTNEISLGNLPGDLTSVSPRQPLFGGLTQANGTLDIGPILNPGPGGLNISALTAASATTIYAINTRPNATVIDPITGLPQQGTANDVLLLTLPGTNPPAGTVTATVLGTIFTPNNATGNTLPVNVTGADLAANGELFFVATTPSGGTALFSVNPSLANPVTPADEVADSLFVAANLLLPPPAQQPGGGGQQQAPTIGSIAFNSTGNLYGVINGGGQGGQQGGQLILIDENTGLFNVIGNLTPQGQQGGGGGGGQAGTIVGLDFNANNDLIAITADANVDSAENVLFINETNAEFIVLGGLGDQQNSTGLAFVPGLTDPFTNATTGAFVGVDADDNLFFVNAADRNPAQSLWNVYVTGGDLTGEIVIGYVDDFPQEPPLPDPYVIRPFDGDIGTVRAINAQNGNEQFVGAPGGSGQALIGALTRDIVDNTDDEERNPFGPQPVPPEIDFGTLPEGVDELASGLVVADGVDLGKFMLGGTLIGAVDARRNLDFFYAGWLLTGQTNEVGDSGFGPGMGQNEGAPEVPDNFKVGGDLRSLYVRGSIGSDGAGANNPTFLTGFDLQVRGSLGNVRSFEGAFYGKVEVNNLDDRGDAFRIRRNQRESEFHNAALGAGFENFEFGPSTTVGADSGEQPDSNTPIPNAFMYNDSFDAPEYLGTIKSSELNGRAGVIRVDGSLQKTPVLQDDADYYAVALMAGQTIAVRVREQIITIPDNITDVNGDGVIDADDFASQVEGGAETDAPLGNISLGVFDPDGRLVASDYNNVRPLLTNQQYVRFTADRPGIYRFAVASRNETAFGGESGLFTVTPYTLTALNVGDVAVGGVVAQSTIYDLADLANNVAGFNLFRGDWGAVDSIGGDFLSDSLLTLNVENGNLRTIEAVNVGQASPSVSARFAPIIDVPRGSVGLVRANGASLALNSQLLPSTLEPIGGDYQLIDGPGATVHVQLRANRGVGVIRGANMAAFADSGYIEVNADNQGRDGIVDLIDVTGDFGQLGAGGPAIITNTGGNVRYIRAGGEVFQDRFFASNEGSVLTFAPGETRTITDDSGARMSFRATGEVGRNPLFDPAFPQAGIPEFIGPGMTMLTYGIRGSGGVVVIDVTSESGMEITANDAAFAEVGRVEIKGIGPEVVSGVIVGDSTSPTGQTILRGDTVRDPDSPTGSRTNYVLDRGTVAGDGGGGGTPTPTPTPTPTGPRRSPDDLVLIVGGGSRVDILNVVVTDTGSDTTSTDNENNTALDADGTVAFTTPGVTNNLGNALLIRNGTGGEIVNIAAESVAELRTSGSLGMARSHTGTAVEGVANLTVGGTLPERDPANGTARPVHATGTDLGVTQPYSLIKEGLTFANGIVQSIRAGKAIGTIAVMDGSIGELVANADGEDDPNEFEGINGTVYVDFSTVPDDLLYLPGRIQRVGIGEGILPTGTGEFARAGIIVGSIVGPVTGTNADIRGDIIANNRYRLESSLTVVDPSGVERQVTSPSNTPIESVFLDGGSIINADIIASSSPGDHVEFGLGELAEFTGSESFTRPEFEVLRVGVRGNGGIIGSNIAGADLGSVTASGGFGIINSNIDALTDGVIQRIEADGYGLRGLIVDSGSVGELTANGDGTSLSTNAISNRVRFSEIAESDPQLGPLDPFFGIESNALTDIHRYLGTSSVQGEISGVTDTGIIEGVEAKGQRDLRSLRAWQVRGQSRFDYANSIGTLNVRDIINGMEMTTGSLKSFTLNRDAFAMTVTVAGRVRKVDIRGSLAGNSVIRTMGDAGQFDNVRVAGNLIGNINSSRAIKSIQIGGDFNGNVSVNSGGTALRTLKVGGAFLGGSLDIVGNVGTIQSAGSLGALGDTLTVTGNVGKILVGGDLRSNVRVTGNVKTLQVKGSIVDGGIEDGLVVDVSNVLTSLIVGGDIQPGVDVNARVIKKQRIGGQNLGEFTIAQ